MNLTKELLINLVKAVVDHQEKTPDVLWCVTSLRTDIFCMFRNLNLSRPNEKPNEPINFDHQLAADIFRDYAEVLSTFPAEIKYTDDNIETPRINALDRTLEVAQGLQSDENVWNSAQELVRLVATNADSEHQRLDYAVLMGIMLKIFDLLDIDAATLCTNAINLLNGEAEA